MSPSNAEFSGDHLPVARSDDAIDVARPQYVALGYADGGGANELSLSTLWRIIFEWRWLILSFIVVGIAIAVVATLLTTPRYRSTAVIELNPPQVAVTEDEKRDPGAAADPQFLVTQLGLLQSRALAERVAQDLNLAGKANIVSQELPAATRRKVAANVVENGLEVESKPMSRLVSLDYTSTDPALAATIVNGFADAFINTTLERRYQATAYARDFLERRIASVRRELETSERELVQYAQSEGIISTGSDKDAEGSAATSLTGQSLVALNQALTEAQTKRITAEQKYRQSLAGGSAAEVSDRTATLRQQKAALEAEYTENLSVYKADYPTMVQLQSRIQALASAIAEEAKNVRNSRSGTAEAEYRAALAEEQRLAQRVEALRGDVLDIRKQSIRYTILQRDVDTNRTLYNALLQRYKEIGVAGGVGASVASIVDRGQVPGGPFSPSLPLNIIIGLFGGLALGLGAAVGLEFLNDTIRSPEDVRNKLRLAFLGGIPKATAKRPVEELRDTGSSLSEAYFSAATALRYTTDHGLPKTLLVTSTRAAEGKSTTSWALAYNFARTGLRVLLIDADLRKPTFQTGHEKDAGLTNLLTGASSLAANVAQTEYEGLWLLPCGPLPPSPAELLSTSRIRQVLDNAAEQFDIVIVDGPPILGLADAPLLSVACQATLMVVEAGKTRTPAAVESHNRLRAAGTTVVGAILTRYKPQSSYGYGYGYGYGRDAYQYRTEDNRDRKIRLTVRDDS